MHPGPHHASFSELKVACLVVYVNLDPVGNSAKVLLPWVMVAKLGTSFHSVYIPDIFLKPLYIEHFFFTSRHDHHDVGLFTIFPNFDRNTQCARSAFPYRRRKGRRHWLDLRSTCTDEYNCSVITRKRAE